MRVAVVLFAAACAAGPMAATTIVYTDRTAWTNAVSGVQTETFESYPWNSPAGDFQSGEFNTSNGIHISNGYPFFYGINSSVVTPTPAT